jgi:nicotinamide phosphoribosyltransferase
LKETILSRDGVLVIRPDSGDPVYTLLNVFDILFEKFGHTINSKGYKVLPPQVRVLQGDGIDINSIRHIYAALKVNGISAENLLLGMGGGLLQKLDRDTQKFALKCSWAQINGQGVNVQKQPVELDSHGQLIPSFKRSKSGRLQLVQTPGGLTTITEDNNQHNQLQTIFENGHLLQTQTFEQIRQRLNQ